jgi:hypothetical protein
MTTDPRVPVPMRVRHVVAGDEFASPRDGSHWRITAAGDVLWHLAGRELVVTYEGRTVTSDRDPDDVLDVLVPVVERDAVELLYDQLGARLITGRTV